MVQGPSGLCGKAQKVNQDIKSQIVRLFHYTTFESALKIIESCALKTTNPKYFNDPFEYWPQIKKIGEYSQKEFKFIIDQHIQEKTSFIQKGQKRWKELNSTESFLTFAKKQLSCGLEEVMKKYQEFYGKHIRLISCSSEPNIIPMWAHYSANHTGVVIEFELETMPFSGLLQEDAVRTVTYSQNRVYYDHLKSELDRHQRRVSGKTVASDIFYEIATTKDMSWQYEEEVRIILPTRLEKNMQLKDWFYKIEDDLFMKLQPKSFKTVYCGMRMPDLNQSILERLIKSRFAEHSLPITRVNPSDGTYDFHPFSEN